MKKAYNPAEEGIEAARADSVRRRMKELKASANKAGHVNYEDGGDTAYVWTETAWCASFRVVRGDMTCEAFKSMVAKIAALAKKGAS